MPPRYTLTGSAFGCTVALPPVAGAARATERPGAAAVGTPYRSVYGSAMRERLERQPRMLPVAADALSLCSASVQCRGCAGLLYGAVPGDCGGVRRVST